MRDRRRRGLFPIERSNTGRGVGRTTAGGPFHTAFGIEVIEKPPGRLFTNSDGKRVFERDTAAQRVFVHLGFIPKPGDSLK